MELVEDGGPLTTSLNSADRHQVLAPTVSIPPTSGPPAEAVLDSEFELAEQVKREDVTCGSFSRKALK